MLYVRCERCINTKMSDSSGFVSVNARTSLKTIFSQTESFKIRIQNCDKENISDRVGFYTTVSLRTQNKVAFFPLYR